MPTTVSVLDAIFQQTLVSINGLNLMLNGQTIPVSIAKLPKREEKVDPPVQIVICLHPKGEKTIPWAMGVDTEGSVQQMVAYPILVVLIVPNNNDQIINLQAYTALRQDMRLLFRDKTPFVGVVPQVWDVDVVEGSFLDRTQLAIGYDYMVVQVSIKTVE